MSINITCVHCHQLIPIYNIIVYSNCSHDAVVELYIYSWMSMAKCTARSQQQGYCSNDIYVPLPMDSFENGMGAHWQQLLSSVLMELYGHILWKLLLEILQGLSVGGFCRWNRLPLKEQFVIFQTTLGVVSDHLQPMTLSKLSA